MTHEGHVLPKMNFNRLLCFSFSSAIKSKFDCSFVSRFRRKQISTKCGGRIGYCPRKNPLNFGADPKKGTDPGIFVSLSLTWREIGWFFFYINTEIPWINGVDPKKKSKSGRFKCGFKRGGGGCLEVGMLSVKS